jgi:hypothetical protein
MDNNKPCPFQIRLTGPAFIKDNKEIDLLDLAIALMEFHKVIDKTYCTLTEQQRLSPANRKQFQIITRNITDGSLLFDNELIINNTQLLLPMIGLLSPRTIWEYTSTGFKFLKTVYEFFKKNNKPPEYKIINPVNCNFITGDNNLLNVSDNTVTIGDPRILDIAAKARPHYNALNKTLNANGIEGFQAGFHCDEPNQIKLNFNNKDMFNQRSIIDKNPLLFQAKVIDFNTEKKTGRLKKFDAKTASFSHDFRFSVIGDQDVIPYIDALKQPIVQVTALTENVLDPVHGLKPLKFQLIDIEKTTVI